MKKIDRQKWYTGGCHYGKIRFQVKLGKSQILKCNCSICRKKGYLHLIVPPEQFHLLQGEESLSTYSFNTHTAIHKFCSTCGVHPFYTPRSHPQDIDVNLNALDDDLTKSIEINDFDGQNWEANIESITET